MTRSLVDAPLLRGSPDGPICAEAVAAAIPAALDLIEAVGGVRPFGVIIRLDGQVVLHVPPGNPDEAEALLEHTDRLMLSLLHGGEALVVARVDAVRISTGRRRVDAVRVLLHRRNRPDLVAFQPYHQEDDGPAELHDRPWLEATTTQSGADDVVGSPWSAEVLVERS